MTKKKTKKVTTIKKDSKTGKTTVKKTTVAKREATRRLKEINKIATDLQKKSGSKSSCKKVYKKKRITALKEAGKIYKEKHK